MESGQIIYDICLPFYCSIVLLVINSSLILRQAEKGLLYFAVYANTFKSLSLYVYTASLPVHMRLMARKIADR
jgi:hypothetical protein